MEEKIPQSRLYVFLNRKFKWRP